MTFSDAVVAIAITLLVLPLVDESNSIGSMGIDHFLSDNKTRLFAFTLSFAVIGNFWWDHHQMYERVKGYNTAMVWGLFVWLFSIVFLPFPTELLATSPGDSVAVHGIYVGTMAVTAIAALFQKWTIVKWPELQDEENRGSATLMPVAVPTIMIILAFVLVVTVPTIGLWALLLLGLSRPLQALNRRRKGGATVG